MILAVAELLTASVSGGSSGSSPLTPALSAISFGSFGGSCPSSSATITPSWTVTNADDATYEIHVLENGTLVSTQLSSSTSYVKNLGEFVESGPYRQFTSAWTYTVQLVRKSDGVVIATRTSAEWAVLYGACDAFTS